MGRLDNRIAVVSGGGQTPGATLGNGRATALRFAQEGAHVLVLDKRLSSAEETVALIEEEGGRAKAYVLDVTRADEIDECIARIMAEFGVIDVLQNNVGIGTGDASPARLTEEVWDKTLATNTTSVMLMCKAVLPHMRAVNRGVITNISSVAAVAAATNITAYKVSKAGLNAYTQALAMSNARFGIRANVIMPGLIETPMAIEGYVASGQNRETVIARRNAAVPLLGQMGSAWDIANASLFLASDEAKFITGVALPVDGGQSAKIG
ncbi:MAG: SDR family NAD(P)-dependent oxidoreductase [Pseudomonadales bacterium]|nr:SDR family NAD(P)-dependent oxidoreductase [Pseudomonadales bacterium]